MRPPQDYGQLATDLATMARELREQESVQQTLDSITTHAVKLINGCDAAGILAIHNGQVHTLAGTEPVTRLIDHTQAQVQEGPCFDAAVHGEQLYRIEDVHTTRSRWPHFAERARELNVGSMMGCLLYTSDDSNFGALDIYSAQRGAFRSDSEHIGWVLASHAAVALANAHRTEQMDRALASSRLIGQAIGIVMSRYALTEQAAFEAIRRTSQTRNIRVRDLAETITATGDLPA